MTLKQETPLVQFMADYAHGDAPFDAGVRMGERGLLGHVNLRGEPSTEGFLEAVEKSVGVKLPIQPNTVSEGASIVALWLGPNEWQLLTPPDRQKGVISDLREVLQGIHSAATDVTGYYTVITISGTHTPDVINKGCPLDLHPRVFRPGQCAQSHIAKANAMIRPTDDTPSYEIVVRRSFADYLARWLYNAAQEYGVVVERHNRRGYFRSS